MAIVANGQKVVTNLTSKKVYLAGETVPDELINVKKVIEKVEEKKSYFSKDNK